MDRLHYRGDDVLCECLPADGLVMHIGGDLPVAALVVLAAMADDEAVQVIDQHVCRERRCRLLVVEDHVRVGSPEACRHVGAWRRGRPNDPFCTRAQPIVDRTQVRTVRRQVDVLRIDG